MGNIFVPKRDIIRARTKDAFQTYDQRTIDSTGAFLVGELERLDQTLHGPLASYTWSRDIDLREDVSIADEMSSFTNSSFAAAGGPSPKGKNWISSEATVIGGIGLDIGKTASPLNLWGIELSWTLPELASAQQLGRPVDQQKFDGMQLKFNMDVDEQVYIGDDTLSVYGLVNNPAVIPTSIANGAGGSPLWKNKTPDEILADVNIMLTAVWTQSAYAVTPSSIRIPPAQFASLVTRKVSDAGNISILEYIKVNNILTAQTGQMLDIQPLKWLVGRGAAGSDRVLVYTKDKNRVRFPMVPLQRTPLEYRGIRQITTYYGKLGVVEFVYSETVGYFDGI